MNRPPLDPETASRLHVAAIVGVAALASELEEVGISGPDESLGDARALRPMIFDCVEQARRDREG